MILAPPAALLLSAVLSLPAYAARLGEWVGLVDRCAQSHDGKPCASESVEPAFALKLGDGSSRPVSFAWLQQTLVDAKNPRLPHRAELLHAAADRLRKEQDRVAEALGPRPRSTPPEPSHEEVNHRLDQILSAAEFRHVQQPNLFSQLWDELLRWFFRHLPAPGAGGGRTSWLAPALWVGVALSAALGVLGLMRRHLRPKRLAPELETAPAGSQEWEQWHRSAEAAAATGRWRDALHDLYWAAIARLEGRGVWPPNRAHTPREYLRLLPPEKEAVRDLRVLTLALERCWYAGRPAQAADFQAANEAFRRLGAA